MTDYEKVFKSMTMWPEWKKELVNNLLLISKHSPKI